jgi:hypothetical protein
MDNDNNHLSIENCLRYYLIYILIKFYITGPFQQIDDRYCGWYSSDKGDITLFGTAL